jgi:hypothetical protein
MGSSDASGRPPDAAVDVRMRDNPVHPHDTKKKGKQMQKFQKTRANQ